MSIFSDNCSQKEPPVVNKRGVDEFIPKEDFWHAKSELIRNSYLTKKRHISFQLNQLAELLA